MVVAHTSCIWQIIRLHTGNKNSIFGNVSALDMINPLKWKSWLMGGSRTIEHAKWPFLFVMFNMTVGGLVYPFRIFSDSISPAMSDCTFLHMFSITNMIAMWVFFLLTYKTEAGGVASNNEETPSCKVLHGHLTKEYEETLEALGAETGQDGLVASISTPLCHSCHITKPIRSKHCRVTRRCVLMFDHYCPFVGNAVGLYNYRYFFMYLLCHCFTEVGYIITGWIYLSRKGFDWYMFLSLVYVGIFIVPGLMMLSYHMQLVSKNLTTNEHQNMYRYDYLKDSSGRYKNNFDGGLMHNFYMRMFPSEDSNKTLAEVRERAERKGGGGRQVEEERLLNNML